MKKKKELHIGSLIKAQLEEQEISQSEFGRMMDITRQLVHDILKRKHIDSELLLKISLVLDVDFFESLSGEYQRLRKKRK